METSGEAEVNRALESFVEREIRPKVREASRRNIRMSDYPYAVEGREHLLERGLLVVVSRMEDSGSGHFASDWYRGAVLEVQERPVGFLERQYGRSQSTGNKLEKPCQVKVKVNSLILSFYQLFRFT